MADEIIKVLEYLTNNELVQFIVVAGFIVWLFRKW